MQNRLSGADNSSIFPEVLVKREKKKKKAEELSKDSACVLILDVSVQAAK